jgi:hypothetical protein
MLLGLAHSPCRQEILSGASFSVSITGGSSDSLGTYAQVGNHAAIGYTETPTSGAETVKWSNSSNPASAATYGTGANPTDFTAGDAGTLYLHVTIGAETVTRSLPIRRAPGSAAAIADGQTWTVDDTAVNINAAASGTGLTWSYALTGAAAGVTINSGTGLITGTPTAVSSGTATVTATDQYGRTVQDTFTYTASLRAQATGGTDLDLSFSEDSAISSTNLIANWTANGNTLTFVSVAPPLPAGLSINSAGTMTGTPTTVTADATYTLTMQDEYARQTSDTFTLEITAAAVNPTLTLTAQTAGSGGNPDSVSATYSYAGSDTVDLYVVTTNTATPQSQANIIAGSGGGIIQGDSQLGYTGGTIDLDGFTTNAGVTHIQAVAVERNNGGTSGVQVIAVTSVDFTAPVVLSVVTNTAGDELTITFDETVIGTNNAANFTMTGHTLSSMAGTGTTRTLAVSPAVANGDVDTLAYTPGNLTNVRGNALASFSGQAITNNVPGGAGSLSIITTSDAEKSAALALVAPTVMWFDAVPSGLGAEPLASLPPVNLPYSNTTDLIHDAAFNEVFYFWKVTTYPAGYAENHAPASDYNMPNAWRSKRIAYGPQVAFCFDAPGDYVLECFAVGPTGTTATASTSFTIVDPDTAYSGSATLCVNPAGDSDFSWAPSGSTNYNTGADDRAVLSGALTAYQTGTTSRRILFKPGTTYDLRGAPLGNWGPIDTRLRHYFGTPLGQSPAILDIGASGNGPRLDNFGNHASVTLSNLHVRGSWNTQAGVPETADGFAVSSDTGWSFPNAAGLSTHCSVYKLRTSKVTSPLNVPFFLAGYTSDGRGVMARTGFAECDIEHSNQTYALFMNFPRDDGEPGPTDPRPRVAFIGCKIASTDDSLEWPQIGYGTTPCAIRGTYSNLYFGACDYYYNGTDQPLLRLHDGGGSNTQRTLWSYINMDRLVLEGGSIGLAIHTSPAGFAASDWSSPANVVVDKVLHIVASGSETSFNGFGHFSCGTWRNIAAIHPPWTNKAEGSVFRFAAASNSALITPGANNAHDLAHPRRISNVTAVYHGTNSQLQNVLRTFYLAGTEAVFDDFVFENSVLHHPDQTFNPAGNVGPFASSTIAGVTPRYPGRNDAQNFITQSLSVANGATFDVTFATINAALTRDTSRAYTQLAASDPYWTNNPTHNFHFIRQSGTYHYIYDGGLAVSVLSDRLRFTNNTGGTLSGSWEIWIDRRGLHPGPQASTATDPNLHLSWVPASGAASFNGYTTGLLAHDDFLGNVRSGKKDPEAGFAVVSGTAETGAFEA